MDTGAVRNFRDLIVWQRSMDLAVAVYEITRDFPDGERYGLVSQMRRAAVSIPSNIAEGHSRNSTGEFIQAVGVAKGSLAELQTQMELSQRLGLLGRDRQEDFESKFIDIARMLNSLLNSIRSK